MNRQAIVNRSIVQARKQSFRVRVSTEGVYSRAPPARDTSGVRGHAPPGKF